MSSNKQQAGMILDLVAPAAILGGAFFLDSATLGGVAVASIASGATGAVDCGRGVFELTKLAGAAWSKGDTLYWDDTAKNFTKTSTSNTKAGVAFAAALSADVTGLVALLGAPYI